MIRNAAVFGAGRIVYAACQWLVMIYLARFYSTEKLGMYSYALALVAPIIMFSQMNMRMYLITDRDNIYSYADYILTRLLMAVVALVVVLCVSIVSSQQEVFLIVLLVAIFKSIESIADILCAILQKNNKIALVAWSNILRGLSLVLSVVIVTISGFSFVDSLGLVAVSWLCIMVFNDYFNASKEFDFSIRTRFSTIRKIIGRCLPLGFVMSIVALNYALPVYFVKYYHGVEMVGFYSALAYFIALGKLVTDSFIQTSSSNVAKYYHEERFIELKKMLGKLLIINAIIGVSSLLVGFVFGAEILSIIYGDEFSSYYTTFLVIITAALFNYMAQVFALLLTVKRSFYRMAMVHILQATVILVTSLITVKSYGVLGGAYALLAGFVSIMFSNIFFLYIDGDINKIIRAT